MPSLLQKGAKNAIVDCLAVKPEDRVFIMTDAETLEIGQALFDEAKKITSEAKMVVLEDYAKRPFKEFPKELPEDLLKFIPTVTIFAAQALTEEMQSLRHPIHEFILKKLKSRHAHMLGIEKKLMETGMQVDYHKVHDRGEKIYKILEKAKTIVATCPYGTDIQVTFTPKHRWAFSDGLIWKKGDWMNLPNGEIFTAPESLNGKVAVQVYGDRNFGLLKKPIMVIFKNSRVVDISGENDEAVKNLKSLIKTDENADRAGELGIGINEFIKELTGNLLQDEKFPGLHVAVGSPIGSRTGAEWDSEIHMDMIPLETTISVDGKVIMKDGNFLI